MATPLKRKLDYADFARLPSDDGNRYEILDGRLYVSPAPSPLHQRLSKRLFMRLHDHFEGRGLGELFYAPIDVVLGPHDIVEPDLVVVARAEQISSRAVEGAPLLAVEILSPSTRRRDRGLKMRRYAELGVAHYWIVDPGGQTLEAWRLEGAAYRLVVAATAPEMFRHPDWPDLAIDLGPLWA
jgi:Uma2 family endonuclease